MAAAEAPASVLDASALLAVLNDEEGADVATEAIARGAAVSIVNWAEVLSKVAERGMDPETAAAELRRAEGSRRALTVEPLTAADCIEVARLRLLTRRQGLSLGDRACLVLATRLRVPALTTDRAWADADSDAEVHIIR
ncbi:MAG: type II toxin-antitoxin system VapC family toxin [Actinobacteria bacterium]|nr:type II toxin-antitoxin system VapC family toxin [Actinomycetota bacterium]